jgi:hypothetical protein
MAKRKRSDDTDFNFFRPHPELRLPRARHVTLSQLRDALDFWDLSVRTRQQTHDALAGNELGLE